MASPAPSADELQAVLNGPSMAPPQGVAAHLDNPPTLKGTHYGVTSACIALGTLALAMRMYTKVRVIRQVLFTDYVLMLGWGLFIGYFVACCLAGTVAPGVHQWNLRVKDLVQLLYYVHVASVMNGLGILLIKVSILLQYLQIFTPVKKSNVVYWASHLLIWANVLFYVSTTFVNIWSCKPVAKAWDPTITEGTCIDIVALNISAATINAASDIAILILPQWVIWRLQMSTKRKCAVSLMFMIGVFACACSIVRLYYTVELHSAQDKSYTLWTVVIWTWPEAAAGTIAACVPVGPRFVKGLSQTAIVSRTGQFLKSLLSDAQPINRQTLKSTVEYPQTNAEMDTFGNGPGRQYHTLDDESSMGSTAAINPRY